MHVIGHLLAAGGRRSRGCRPPGTQGL